MTNRKVKEYILTRYDKDGSKIHLSFQKLYNLVKVIRKHEARGECLQAYKVFENNTCEELYL
tara:strand:- start:322 stop:507 length:186 start_codon:yes stop_codon:yes gene_type:complete